MDNLHKDSLVSPPHFPRGVVPATPWLIADLAGRLSPEHAREVRGASGLDPAAALLLSFESSVETYAFVPRRGTRALFAMGAEHAAPMTGSAMVWMLGTTEASAHPAGVLRASRWGVARAFTASGAERLEQYVPAWYRTGLRFIARLGFALHPTRQSDRCGCRLWHAVLHRPDRMENDPDLRKG